MSALLNEMLSGIDQKIVGIVSSSLIFTNVNASTYSQTIPDIGAASPNRLVIAAIGGQFGSGGAKTVVSATINGIACNIDTQIAAVSGGTTNSAILSAIVPTGTTNIPFNVTWSGNLTGMASYITTIYGVSTAGASSTNSVTGLNVSTLTTSAPLVWDVGDFVVGICHTAQDNTPFTWSGLTKIGDYNYNAGVNRSFSPASRFPIASTTGTNITSSFTSTSARSCLSVAVY